MILDPVRLAVTFGAANRLYRRLSNTAAYRAIVLDFSEVPHIDESGIIALENISGRQAFAGGLACCIR